MALKDLYHRGELEGKSLKQIIAFAGTGKLLDGNDSSSDFREYLKIISLSELKKHAEECLENNRSNFPNNGIVLQDIVNELGRRLGFNVINGRYHGSQNEETLGYDGAWLLPGDNDKIKQAIIVEVKTSDTYSLDIKTIDQYRQGFAKERNLDIEKTSILLVVGNVKQDTRIIGEQIRGSRYAWDMRAIRVQALFQIAEAREKTDDSFERIREILIPQEYMVLDAMADMILSVSLDASADADIPSPDDVSEPSEKPVGKLGKSARQLTIDKVNEKLKKDGSIKEHLMLHRRSVFSTPNNECWAVCYTSRSHGSDGSRYFWFSLSPKNWEILDKEQRSWLILGGAESSNTPERIFLIPWAKIVDLIDESRDRKGCWHMNVMRHNEGWYISNNSEQGNIDITKYLI